ncbi:MAG: hypothetical protein QNJ41_12880 [Xenococcaceae cyanobacterium MO_188.B32]|nr:hypothetical protein [Xenococcaceae cyanobacterium MO_188.B32]
MEQRLVESRAGATINSRQNMEKILLELDGCMNENRSKSSRKQSRINQGS